MPLKINPILATAIIIGVIILLIALIKGCHENKGTYAKYRKVDSLNNVLLHAASEDKRIIDSSKKLFQDSLEFERGQKELALAQKERTEDELDDVLQENNKLIAQHKLAQYTDTSAVTVPNGFITECNDCFSKLEITTNVSLKYKSDYNKLQENWDRHEKLYQNRFKEIEVERLRFNNKISTLAKQQQDAIDKLKPHGRLYLSWGVLWSPWPVSVGGGLMYQNKRNLIYGLKWYYGRGGTTIETTLNFPLSLRF